MNSLKKSVIILSLLVGSADVMHAAVLKLSPKVKSQMSQQSLALPDYDVAYDSENDEYSDSSRIDVRLTSASDDSGPKSCMKVIDTKEAKASTLAVMEQKKFVIISSPRRTPCEHIISEQEYIVEQIEELKDCSVATPINVMQDVASDIGSALVAYMSTAGLLEDFDRLSLGEVNLAPSDKAGMESIKKSKESIMSRMMSRKRAREAILDKLIRHQKNINDQDANGNTLLHLCMIFGYEKGVNKVLKIAHKELFAADIIITDLLNKAGKDALHCSVFGLREEIQKLFRVYAGRKLEKAKVDAMRPNYLQPREPKNACIFDCVIQ